MRLMLQIRLQTFQILQLLIKPRRRRRRIRNISAPNLKLTKLKKEIMKGKIKVRRRNIGKGNIRKFLLLLMILKLTLRILRLVKNHCLRGKKLLLKALRR
jgi:hypothetical protein